MKYKYILIPAILGFAGLLLTANSAHAQRGGGGGGRGGGGGGGGRGGAYHGGGYHHGGFYGGGFYGGGFYGGGFYPYSYAYDPYPYYAPRVAYYPPPVVIGGDVAPYVAPAAPAAPPVASDAANIRVLVLDPQAKVWFDGNLTKQDGTDRLFHTPALAPGGAYSYRIRAAWTQNGQQVVQEQVVPVTLGQTATADFTRPVSEPVPPPK